MSLPEVRRATAAELVRFEWRVAAPLALEICRRRIGVVKTARVAARYLRKSFRDPLSKLSAGGWPEDAEPLVRIQLRSAVRLDDATRGVVPEGERIELLREIIGETGARFLQQSLTLPAPGDWLAASPTRRRAYIEQLTGLFFNAKTRDVAAGESSMRFDVCACRFAQLCQALGRPQLASMFCDADSIYFARADIPVRLGRTETIAAGAERCDFRFTLEA